MEPQIESLSLKSRQRFFLSLVVIFVLALPALIFYTTGYRLNFENQETAIVTTGGMYITTDNLEVDVYLDEEQVDRPRLFRSAYYIQNIAAGQHRVVVQRPDLLTWVKELPIDAYIVTEASAFNMPIVPHVRPITKYVTATGTPVYLGVASTTQLFSGVTTTLPVLITLSTRTGNYKLNDEYTFVKSLFASSTATSTKSVFKKIMDEVDRFRFSTSTEVLIEATTTEVLVERGNMSLVEKTGELYAVWNGTVQNIPYYFCITNDTPSSTALRYGNHVALQVSKLLLSTTTPMLIDSNRICRPEIKLDRLRQDVYLYDFFPNSSDLVLLQLQDGLYVTEIDDRSWQNTQQVYPGTDFRTVVENGVIYIMDGDKYFELVTEIQPI
ncbi:MAG: hypothetical protein RLZZ230_62 [Candidatus Parcubacteria bacterium]|jgi:hypothetical protein